MLKIIRQAKEVIAPLRKFLKGTDQFGLLVQYWGRVPEFAVLGLVPPNCMYFA